MDHANDALSYSKAGARRGVEMSDLIRDDYQRNLQALRGNVIYAWEAMKTAGFSIADDATPLDMVTHLLKRNQDQKRLEDGLRERLKAVEGGTRRLIWGCHGCPFTKTWDQRGDVVACGPLHRKLGFCPDASRPTEALDDCPAIAGILVKKAEEDSGSASGEAKATHDDCPQDKKDRGGI